VQTWNQGLGPANAEHSVPPTRFQGNNFHVSLGPEVQEDKSKEGKLEEGTDEPHESDLLLLRIQWMLLPLLMKEEILNKDFWATDHVDSVAVSKALDSIVMEL
jgi:hypothetical protein